MYKVMKILESKGKHLSVFVCVCTYTYIILKNELTDTPMRSCLQAEFPTLSFSTRLNQDVFATEAKDLNI